MTSNATHDRPPLPKWVKLTLGLGGALFLLPMLHFGLGLDADWLLWVGVGLAVALLAVAFMALREGFSRREAELRRRKKAGSKAVAVVLALAASGALSAHVIERDASFFQMDLGSDLVAAVEVLEATLSSARLEMLETYRCSPGLTAPEKGSQFTIRQGGINIDRGIYQRGVVLLFANASNDGKWLPQAGGFMGSTRTREEWDADKRINFLDLLATPETVREAILHHCELQPSHVHKMPESVRERALELASKPEGGLRWTPLIDERIAIQKKWIESGNLLLTISALMDAYEIANEVDANSWVGMDSMQGYGTPPVMLSDEAKQSLSELANLGLAHPNWHVQSAALAVFERIGLESAEVQLIADLAAKPAGEHLAIVRCEAIRFLGHCHPLGEEHLKLLVRSLLDPTLSDEQTDYPALGIAATRGYDMILLPLVEPFVESENWYDNHAGVRGLAAIGSRKSMEKLERIWREEPPGELRDLMEFKLLDSRLPVAREIAFGMVRQAVKLPQVTVKLRQALDRLIGMSRDVKTDEFLKQFLYPEDPAAAPSRPVRHTIMTTRVLIAVDDSALEQALSEAIEHEDYRWEFVSLFSQYKFYAGDNREVLGRHLSKLVRLDPTLPGKYIGLSYRGGIGQFYIPKLSLEDAEQLESGAGLAGVTSVDLLLVMRFFNVDLWDETEARMIELVSEDYDLDTRYHAARGIALFRIGNQTEVLRELPVSESVMEELWVCKALRQGSLTAEEGLWTDDSDELDEATPRHFDVISRVGLTEINEGARNLIPPAAMRAYLDRVITLLESGEGSLALRARVLNNELSRITGLSMGFCSAMSLDAESVAELARRWREWLPEKLELGEHDRYVPVEEDEE